MTKQPPHLAAERVAWKLDRLNTIPRCMWCGGGLWVDSQVHEIERKSQAVQFRWMHTSNYLLLHGFCHSERIHCQNAPSQTVLLAHKMICDPDHYDLEKWRTLRPGHPRQITQDEVDEECSKLERLIMLFSLR